MLDNRSDWKVFFFLSLVTKIRVNYKEAAVGGGVCICHEFKVRQLTGVTSANPHPLLAKVKQIVMVRLVVSYLIRGIT